MIVLCAAASYSGIKAADRHMAEHLSRLVPVLYVDPPLSAASVWRDRPAACSLRGARLRVEEPGLARLTPVVQPGPSRHALAPVTSVLARWYVRHAVGRLGGRVQAVVSAWPQYPVFGCCDERVRVYWSQDDFVGGAGLLGLDARHLGLRERGVAASADFVAAVSPVLAETWRDRDSDTVLIPNGADLEAYADVNQAAWPADVHLPGPLAGFVGHLNARTDLRLLEAIAGRGRSLLLVGPKDPAFEPERFRALLGRPNVCWVGPKPFEALPGYLRLIDVGIVPYGDSPFNRGSFPLKVLEYLAAGRAVVATDLPSIRWLATDLVTTASRPGAFAEAVDRSLDEVRSPAMIEKRTAFAAMHGWARPGRRPARGHLGPWGSEFRHRPGRVRLVRGTHRGRDRRRAAAPDRDRRGPGAGARPSPGAPARAADLARPRETPPGPAAAGQPGSGRPGRRSARLEFYQQRADQGVHGRRRDLAGPIARTALVRDFRGRLGRAHDHVEPQRPGRKCRHRRLRQGSLVR